MKGAIRKYWPPAFGKPAKERLIADLGRLALYCQPADPKAKSATDVDEAMKQFTWWPQRELLEQIEDGVLTIALTQRKYPARRIWKNFELVNKRNRKLHLLFETVGEDCITADDESSIIAAVQRNYRVFKVKTKTLRSFTLIFATRYCGISEMVSRWRRQLEAPG